MVSRRDFHLLCISLGISPFIPKKLYANPLENYILQSEELQGAQGYINLITEACARHKKIFPIPPIVEIIKIKIESEFNENAVSPACAVGLAQFMPETARGYGMNVYDGKYDELMYMKERRLKLDNSIKGRSTKKGIKNLSPEGLKRLQRDVLSFERLDGEVKSFFEEYKKDLIANKSLDDRLNPEIAVNNGVHYLVTQAVRCKKYFGGPDLYIIVHALASYNAGFGNVIKSGGIPVNNETPKYVKDFMRIYCKLYSML